MERILPSLVCAAVFAGVALSQSTEARLAFVIADVHPSPDASGGGIFFNGRGGGFPYAGGGRYEIRRATLLNLINQAYGIDNEKILGGPNWLEWDSYDINAKLPLPPESMPDNQKEMLKTLLADRFKLVVHADTKELPAYVLTAGKTPKTVGRCG